MLQLLYHRIYPCLDFAASEDLHYIVKIGGIDFSRDRDADKHAYVRDTSFEFFGLCLIFLGIGGKAVCGGCGFDLCKPIVA